MEVLYPRCAGLDVHANTVVACVRVTAGRSTQHTHRTVGTTTRGLLELAQWLHEQQVTHVAMEATGVFWKPVWHVLEDSFTLVLANAMHIRRPPPDDAGGEGDDRGGHRGRNRRGHVSVSERRPSPVVGRPLFAVR